MYNFEKLTVWQKAMDFCELVYKETKRFPKEEMFGLTSQLRRASTSIPLNIAEGSACSSKREFRYFLGISLRSQHEIATTLMLCKRIGMLKQEAFAVLSNSLDEIGRLLAGLIRSISTETQAKCQTTKN